MTIAEMASLVAKRCADVVEDNLAHARSIPESLKQDIRDVFHPSALQEPVADELFRAELAAKVLAERERCAKIAESHVCQDYRGDAVAESIAREIRGEER